MPIETPLSKKDIAEFERLQREAEESGAVIDNSAGEQDMAEDIESGDPIEAEVSAENAVATEVAETPEAAADTEAAGGDPSPAGVDEETKAE